MLKKITLLLFTLRHLKFIQFYWRLYLKVRRLVPFESKLPTALATKRLELQPTIAKHPSLNGGRFCFLNQSAHAGLPVDWQASNQTKLWQYNLHYFDYLNQAEGCDSQGLRYIRDWIAYNPPGHGNAWEPYPLSLRIVNWIKFLDRQPNGDFTEILQSLFLQCRFLSENLEYHLLGNHLFKNGVALLFGGSFFQGWEASNWRQIGQRIIQQQLAEQILNDGGHFERSPMYHALILEDLLDCLNLQQACADSGRATANAWRHQAARMLSVMIETLHPDGEIGFFNDSALGIAPEPTAVLDYAKRLGLAITEPNQASNIALIAKPNFGLYVLQNRHGRLLLDAGFIGPDYLPGHAHCDTLSYELSLGQQRCIVNLGTYQYAGPERNQFRSTAAHNTVRIDSEEQHEIWSTFRVARRGYPQDIQFDIQTDHAWISAAHNGYRRLPGRPLHRRKVSCETDGWQITDWIEGQGTHLAESFIHFHPDVRIAQAGPLQFDGHLGDMAFSILIDSATEIALLESYYSPEFGLKQPCQSLCLRSRQACPFLLAYRITIHP